MLAVTVLDRADHPVTHDLLGKRVELAEEGVGHLDRPHRAGFGGSCTAVGALPTGHPLGALDDDVLTLGRLVGDASGVAQAAESRRDPLAVLPAVDDDPVTGLRELGGGADGAERAAFSPLRVVGAGGGDMEHGGHDGVSSRGERVPSRLYDRRVWATGVCRPLRRRRCA